MWTWGSSSWVWGDGLTQKSPGSMFASLVLGRQKYWGNWRPLLQPVLQSSQWMHRWILVGLGSGNNADFKYCLDGSWGVDCLFCSRYWFPLQAVRYAVSISVPHNWISRPHSVLVCPKALALPWKFSGAKNFSCAETSAKIIGIPAIGFGNQDVRVCQYLEKKLIHMQTRNDSYIENDGCISKEHWFKIACANESGITAEGTTDGCHCFKVLQAAHPNCLKWCNVYSSIYVYTQHI